MKSPLVLLLLCHLGLVWAETEPSSFNPFPAVECPFQDSPSEAAGCESFDDAVAKLFWLQDKLVKKENLSSSSESSHVSTIIYKGQFSLPEAHTSGSCEQTSKSVMNAGEQKTTNITTDSVANWWMNDMYVLAADTSDQVQDTNSTHTTIKQSGQATMLLVDKEGNKNSGQTTHASRGVIGFENPGSTSWKMGQVQSQKIMGTKTEFASYDRGEMKSASYKGTWTSTSKGNVRQEHGSACSHSLESLLGIQQQATIYQANWTSIAVGNYTFDVNRTIYWEIHSNLKVFDGHKTADMTLTANGSIELEEALGKYLVVMEEKRNGYPSGMWPLLLWQPRAVMTVMFNNVSLMTLEKHVIHDEKQHLQEIAEAMFRKIFRE